MRFEFDPGKSTANLAKHGINFEAAQMLWQDDRRRTIQSFGWIAEERWLVIGAVQDKLWTAIVTYRGEAIRIISVRRARKEEQELYGDQNQAR